MIHHYQIIIQYKGTRYLGWQIQPEAMGLTVQGELNKALTQISKAKPQSMGSGRTDTGVHALGQVVKVSIELEIDPDKLLKALNGNLPEDIRVIHAKNSDAEFHPTVNAISKEYHYRFTCTRQPTALQNDLIGNYAFDLDVEKMRKACQILVGEHDFANHFCQGTDVSSTVRIIFECDILEVPQNEWGMLPAHYIFRIVGNGFLKQMVRLLMGAVWNVGRSKISIEDFASSLTSSPTERMGATAPPQGLYMVRVNY